MSYLYITEDGAVMTVNGGYPQTLRTWKNYRYKK